MRRLTVTVLASVLTFVGLIVPGVASALTAEEMYQPDTMVAIKLDLPQASIETLEADPQGDYVEGEFSLAETDGTPGDVGEFFAPLVIGVRLKGSTSFQNLNGKSAFKIKFNEFVDGQKFLGLKKMTLNNMVQDPSMTHEALAYETFAAADVEGPRAGFAQLNLNGENFGVLLNVETLDDVALEKRFGEFDDPQHLYEGEARVDVLPGAAEEFEVDEGDEDNLSDMETLIHTLHSIGDFGARMAPVADLAQMTRMWAVEHYIAHWDGYSLQPEPNNYYLYSNPAGIFQMLPWGTDHTWEQAHLPFDQPGAALFSACLADSNCANLYRKALAKLATVVPTIGLDALATDIEALLKPWQELEEPSRRPYTAAEIAAGVAATRDFIAIRPSQLADWLAPPTTVPPPVVAAPPAIRMSPRLNVNRSRLDRGLLITRVRVPTAGRVVQLAWIPTRKGPIRACKVQRNTTEAGMATMRCILSKRVRNRLRVRWLKLRIRTRVVPRDGRDAASVRRVVVLPRQDRR